MPGQLCESLQRELLAQARRLRQDAEAQEGILPQSEVGKLERVEALLTETIPDTSRLALLGHGLLAWHLDQGFREVKLHGELAALARRLVELQTE